MSTKRVLHVVGAMNRGGAETMLMSIYRVLDRNKVQFDFLELSSGESDYSVEIRRLGGRIFKCDWSQSVPGLWKTVRDVSALISKEGPFVAVHSHVLFASGTALCAANRAGVAVRVAHSHNTSSQDKRVAAEIYRWFARRIIRGSATHFLACTADAGKYLFGAHKFGREGVVIPNAVDLGQFYPASAGENGQVLAAIGFLPERLKIVSVARLEPVKNHTFLIEVAATLATREFDFDMIFVGDGSLRPVLEQKVSDLGLDSRVHFWGVRENVAEILRCCDVLVMPSHFEGLPVALIEAQATGLQCLVSENVTKEVNMGLGLIRHLPTTSPTAWADALTGVFPSVPSSEEIHRRLDGHGYTVESALERLLAQYPIGDLKVE